MTAVSLQCKLKNHHPEWSNVKLLAVYDPGTLANKPPQVYNTTFIRWTTHNPSGLSAKDTSLAALCDELARDFGEIHDDTAAGASFQLKYLADQTASTAGGCCTPNKSCDGS